MNGQVHNSDLYGEIFFIPKSCVSCDSEHFKFFDLDFLALALTLTLSAAFDYFSKSAFTVSEAPGSQKTSYKVVRVISTWPGPWRSPGRIRAVLFSHIFPSWMALGQ